MWEDTNDPGLLPVLRKRMTLQLVAIACPIAYLIVPQYQFVRADRQLGGYQVACQLAKLAIVVPQYMIYRLRGGTAPLSSELSDLLLVAVPATLLLALLLLLPFIALFVRDRYIAVLSGLGLGFWASAWFMIRKTAVWDHVAESLAQLVTGEGNPFWNNNHPSTFDGRLSPGFYVAPIALSLILLLIVLRNSRKCRETDARPSSDRSKEDSPEKSLTPA